MIAPGTLCLVVRHAYCHRCSTDVFGWTCTVVEYLGRIDFPAADPLTPYYAVSFPRRCCGVPATESDTIIAPALQPIAPPGDPDAVDTRVPEETFA